MLSSATNKPIHILGLTATNDEPRPQLPSKHQRDFVTGLEPYAAPFIIKPYPDSPHVKLVTFRPIRVVGRSQLPLTFLDTTVDESLPSDGLFSAHIDVLESIDGTQEQTGQYPKVLIAQYEAKKTLYTIERVQTRVYSICKLVQWLKEEDVTQLWSPSKTAACAVYSAPAAMQTAGGPWWQHAVVEVQPFEQPVKRARMGMVRPKPELPPAEQEPRQQLNQPLAPQIDSKTIGVPGSSQECGIQPPTSEQQLESLVQQYLDAVYISKTSLAYFAKGPITRIRNAFTSPDEDAPRTHELVMFLRSMLLSPKASEKKYYEKLPSIIRNIPTGLVSDEELTTKSNKAKKSKKKLKISRDGVYPLEDAFVRKWWRSEMPSAENAGEETMETRSKRRIGDLRVRETLAQMILMLEIIALESLVSYKAPSEMELPNEEGQTHHDTQSQPKKRKKKLDDIALQLDLLLDRLSIWHVTEEAGILDFDAKTSKQHDNSDGPGKGGASDRLQGFCVEVIVPFYMSRLPEQAHTINKKLGGPANAATSKRKAMKPPLRSKKSKDSKEPETKKSRRSLARVSTDTTGKIGDRSTPSLARSVTDTALLRQSIKRETSEAPLSAIPFQRSPSRARQSMSQLRHLQGREMDLTTTSAAAAAKLKHKARVEDDLKEAIATLKKPNRDLAAGSYMADIEKRGLGSANRSRKPANPVRKVVKDVQVTATPRAGRRTKNMIEQTPVRHHQDPFIRPAATEAAPLSDLCIPSSGVRQPSSVVPGTIQRSVTARELAHTGVAETPSKAPTTKMFTSGAARRTIFATPVKTSTSTRLFREDEHSTSNIFETPTKKVGSSPSTISNQVPPMVAATPVKALAKSVEATPIAFATPAKTADESSIYDVLGWNDDDDYV
ncbi:hypothetical protein N0V94_003521 [Neodidymelliopsis sp. IMI 364377]|nr:hypothetical protein N0V94_003521 [Neodidymelliopsis sp. IMI 364377]